jgi:hypothetical protein
MVAATALACTAAAGANVATLTANTHNAAVLILNLCLSVYVRVHHLVHN